MHIPGRKGGREGSAEHDDEWVLVVPGNEAGLRCHRFVYLVLSFI